MNQPIYCHWDTPPSWWVDGVMVWYFGAEYWIQVHQRYDDGSITYRLTPVAPQEDAV